LGRAWREENMEGMRQEIYKLIKSGRRRDRYNRIHSKKHDKQNQINAKLRCLTPSSPKNCAWQYI